MRELVGQGKPFYSSLDKAAGLLRRKVGTGSEFLKELMSIPGVKQAEIAERGLGELLNAPKMTHEQFMAALSAKPAPAIGEKVLGEQLSPRELAKETNAFIRAQARRYASNMSDNSREYRILAGDEMRRLRGEHLPSIREHVRIGQRHFQRVNGLVHEAEEALTQIREDQTLPTGLIRISTSVIFGETFLAPVIWQLAKAHPTLRFELVLGDELVDIVKEGIDFAIRLGQPEDSELIGQTLGSAS